MTLYKLNACPTILLEDDCDKNILPLVTNLVQSDKHVPLYIYNYEKQLTLWKNVFEGIVIDCFEGNKNYYEPFNNKAICFIDSVNQMTLYLGWIKTLKLIRQLQSDQNVFKMIIVLHRDCLLPISKIQVNLNHIANAIITYDDKNCQKLYIQIKKSGKIIKTEELLSYDNRTKTLTLNPEPKPEMKTQEPVTISPSSLTTFKIETDQTQQLEKYKLQLPYMSKINEGQGKVYYEPDAVDDWDEEDPDEDLEI